MIPKPFGLLLHNGIDAITEVPPERWNIDSYYDPDPEARGKIYTRYGGIFRRGRQIRRSASLEFPLARR